MNAQGPGLQTPHGYGGGDARRSRDMFSETFVAATFETKAEATYALSYLSTRVVRYLIKGRRVSQHTTQKVYEDVPDLPMDRVWTDEMLYEEMGLTKSEQKIIEEATTSPEDWLGKIKDPVTGRP